MSDQPPLPRMAAVAAQYTTKTSLLTLSNGNGVLCLKADPRRYKVQFWTGQGGTAVPMILPGPPVVLTGLINSVTNPIEHKWRDGPSVCAGEFYSYAGAIATVICVEVLYVGDL